MLRRSVLPLIVVVGLAALGVLFVGNVRLSRQELKSCFNDASGLKAGAAVRIAGVDVGTVRSVRANPQNKNCPAEVEMNLATSYDLRVPKDAITAIETDGLLGQSYVVVDTSLASGPPVENFGYLRSKPNKPTASVTDYLKALDLMLKLVDASKEMEKELPPSTNTSQHSPKH